MLINGENTGSNFITPTAFKFAKEKVESKKHNTFLTIDEYRLFNNMLSSMPMCFNLFSDLKELLKTDSEEASRIIRHLLPELDWIDTVIVIDVEFLPTPIEDYTNDRSAFDAMIQVRTVNGGKGLISIETKYTDLLGSNSSSNTEIKNRLVAQDAIFKPDLIDALKINGYQQIHRNYLLTYAYAKKDGFNCFANVVLSPLEDQFSVKEIEDLRSKMTGNQETILKINLQDLVKRGIECSNTEIQEVMRLFSSRYLEYV